MTVKNFLCTQCILDALAYVPSGSKVGSRGLALSFMYTSRANEEGVVILCNYIHKIIGAWGENKGQRDNPPYNFKLIMNHFLLRHDTHFMNDNGRRETDEVHVELLLEWRECTSRI